MSAPAIPSPLPHEVLLGEMMRSYMKAFPLTHWGTGSPVMARLELTAFALHNAGHTVEDIRGVVFHPSGVNFMASLTAEFPWVVKALESAHPRGCACLPCRNKVM